MAKKTALPVEPVVETVVKKPRVKATKPVATATPVVETIVAEPTPAEITVPVKSAPAKKAHKPAVRQGRQLESVVVLYEKFVEATDAITNKVWADEADRQAKAIVDRGDKHADRLAMLDVMLKTREYGRFEKRMVQEVNLAWKELERAWIDWVKAENALGHNGELALGREFTERMIAIHHDAQRSLLWENGSDAMDQVLAGLESLRLEVANYVQNWCQHEKCGEPIRDGWVACPAHYVRKSPREAFTPPNFAKRKVKKPGSAAKRDQNRGPKGKRVETDGEKKAAKKAAQAARRGEGK